MINKIALLMLTVLFVSACSSGTEECINPEVVDGDTIKCSNLSSSIRIMPAYDQPDIWFDTPETSMRNAECESEKILGLEAKQEFKNLIQNQKVHIVHPNPNEKTYDTFGRILAQVQVNNINISHHLTSLSLGKIYDKSEHPVSWCNE